MLSFASDYITGAHPEVLQALSDTNLIHQAGYGSDEYSESAKNKIREAIGCPDADIYFAVGGTQTNQLVISTMLESYQGVISPESGHVAVHEAGAIEYSGRKVLTIPGHMGKIDVKELDAYMEAYSEDDSRDQMVHPGMVYISQPTEYGSIYSLDELKAIYSTCRKWDLQLFIDGARLGYALASKEADFSMKDIASLCDVFYIGGTKVGALCGEAIVFTKKNMPSHYIARAKQRGALIAKGRLLGVQFDTLFTNDLYMRCSRKAIEQTGKMIEILKSKGISFYYESPTNQQFVILEEGYMESLAPKVTFGRWERYDEKHFVVRFAATWSTTDEELEELRKAL